MIGVANAVELLSRGELTAQELVRQCLAEIDDREPAVEAWEVLDRDGAIREARRIDALADKPALRGVPVGIKDLIDTAGLPTAYGSPAHRGHVPLQDAECVRRLRDAGAVILGKTVTTEFAVYTPGKTHNPHDPARTPGGSSSGSAAAVAAGMVPFAVGTQTAGSVIRPASFCGVIGWKPTFGVVPLDGVRPLAASLDTLGFFVRELEDVPIIAAALGAPIAPARLHRRPVFGFCRTEVWNRADASTRASVEDAARRLAASGADVQEVELPRGLVDAQMTIMAAEAAAALRDEKQLSARLQAFVEEGRAIAPERVKAAHELVKRVTFPRVDAIVTPAATGEAPVGLDTTGDPSFSRIWTLLGGPCASLPLLRGPAGLPVGLQLVCARGDDGRLLAAATFVQSALAAG